MNSEILITLPLGLTANLVADWYLARDAGKAWILLSQSARFRRFAGWLSVLAGLLFAFVAGVSPHQVFALAVCAVSARMDFESHMVPPDAYMYASTAGLVLLAGAINGLPTLITVASTQAVSYGLAVLLVRYLGIMAGGDIKLAMQFGAALGSLPALADATLVAVGAMVVFLVIAIVCKAVQESSLQAAFRHAQVLRTALGVFLWIGAVAAQCLRSSGAAS